MMHSWLARLPLLAALMVVAYTPSGALAKPHEAKLLRNLHVVGELEDGGTFKGKVTITELGYDETEGLTVSGVIHGVAKPVDGSPIQVNEEFADVPATLADITGGDVAGAQAAAVCEILELDIGAIHLDLLGLVVDLAPVHLDLVAESGSGNLLGNLLCAVTGLLDPVTGLLDLIADLGQLLDLIGDINDLLGGVL